MKFKIFGWLLLFVLLGGIGYLAVSILNKPSYKVEFNSDGGSYVASTEVIKNSSLESYPKPTRENYEFLGWFLEDKEFTPDTKITENITLTAKWTLKNAKDITLTFDSLEGTKIAPLTLKEGTILTDIPKPTKDGYNFITWYYHNKEFDFTKPLTKSITLVAKWEKLID